MDFVSENMVVHTVCMQTTPFKHQHMIVLLIDYLGK